MRIIVVAACAIIAVGVMIGLGWIGTANDLALTHFAQPKYEAIRRETFEQSKAYNQGMIQNLHTMQVSYIQADEAHKVVLGAVILHEVADYDVGNLPPDLQAFVRSLRTTQAGN
jgi:hypothetical protein